MASQVVPFSGVGRTIGVVGTTNSSGSGSRSSTPTIARYAIMHHPDESAVIIGEGRSHLQGRSSTPARLGRVFTPLKGRRGLNLAELSATREEGEEREDAVVRRIEQRSRRKLRRWANDELAGVAQLIGPEDEEKEKEGELGRTYVLEWKSNFTQLMTEENTDLREKFLQGYGVAPRGGKHDISRRLSRTALQDAEARFVRLEKRLRSILIEVVKSDTGIEGFLEAVEGLLRSFVQGEEILGGMEEGLPLALRRCLGGPVTKKGSVLVLPLKKSAFLRLLVHGSCQYYGLKSKSQDQGEEIRAVMIQLPAKEIMTTSDALTLLPMPLLTFIKTARLHTHLTRQPRGRCLVEYNEEGLGLDVEKIALAVA